MSMEQWIPAFAGMTDRGGGREPLTVLEFFARSFAGVTERGADKDTSCPS
jgi:hypothetical protein